MKNTRIIRNILLYLLGFLILCLVCIRCLTNWSNAGSGFRNLEEDEYFIQYLGTGGFLIKKDNLAVLTAPLFSNPLLPVVMTGELHPDKQAIRQYAPDLSNVDTLLIGHAHYDHMLDVPYLTKHYMQQAMLYGSITVRNILISELPAERVVALNDPKQDYMASHTYPGTWIYRPVAESDLYQLRFLAIKSSHAPHFGNDKLNYTLFMGKVAEPLVERPKYAHEWKEGQTLAFLIDILDRQGNIRFRIFFQDAVSSAPVGLPPAAVLAEKRIDAAILCVPCFDKVSRYPEYIIEATSPRTVILGHWEDFFLPYSHRLEDTVPLPLSLPEIFIHRLEQVMPADGQWILPVRGSVYILQEE